MVEIKKLKDLEYNELITLGVIESDEDLHGIFTEEIKIPFNILFRLSKDNELSDSIKDLLITIFDKIILTKKEFIDKYLRLASSDGTSISVSEPMETPVKHVEEVIPQKIEEPVVETVLIPLNPKKEKALPRRFGKSAIVKEIEKQNGVATNAQLTALAVNDLKNIYVNLNARLIKDMLSETRILTDVEYRDIRAAIKIIKNKLETILKKK